MWRASQRPFLSRRDREFESCSLHRRVYCEPEFSGGHRINETVGPLPQTGLIGFKSTGSATRHTSTQDRPASDVSLSPTVPRFTSETDPLAEREGFEHSVPERNHLLPA